MATDTTQGELIDRVVKIKRCAAVVKGGRRFSFAAMVVVGNGNGKVEPGEWVKACPTFDVASWWTERKGAR